MTVQTICRMALAALTILASGVSLSGQTIKLGTVAPEESAWHEILVRMGQDWKRISGGTVNLTIFAGGVTGDEVGMLRRTRLRTLHAVALSGVGLSYIDPSASAMQIPMLIDSYEELDYVRERIAPELEKIFLEKGYRVLLWGDVGWVHFFTKEPARTLDDIREMKLWTTAGDPEAEQLYKEFGMQPVPLPQTDMITSLTTGLINAFDVPPLFALLDQSFAIAPHMIDVKWSPLIGATVINESTWQSIPAELRPQLLAAAHRAGDSLREEIRRLGDEAIVEMEKRGLEVYHASPDVLATWRTEAEAAYPALRGTLVPAELFDEVVRLHDEFQNRVPEAAMTMSSTDQSAIEGGNLNLKVGRGDVATVDFSSSRSSDPDGSIVAWEWRINGSEASTASSFSLDLATGNHVIELTVTDNEGATATTPPGSGVVVTEETPSQAPEAAADKGN